MNIFKLLRRIYILRILKKLIYNPLRTFRMFKSIMVLNRIIAKDELVVGFYDRYLVHYTFSAPIIEKLSASGKKVLYLVADKEHPIFLRKYAHVYPILIDRDFELLLKAVKLKLLITPASSFHVHSKSNKTKVAYLFHSPVSMHYVYDDNAFDAYDIFFAVGPHHKREY